MPGSRLYVEVSYSLRNHYIAHGSHRKYVWGMLDGSIEDEISGCCLLQAG